jgi:hypothetical protein
LGVTIGLFQVFVIPLILSALSVFLSIFKTHRKKKTREIKRKNMKKQHSTTLGTFRILKSKQQKMEMKD